MYLMKNTTPQYLISHGFHYSKTFSSPEESHFIKDFRVYRKNNTILLEAEIRIIAETGQIFLNVFNEGTRERYAPFYYYKDRDATEALKEIYSEIYAEFDRLNISDIDENGNKIQHTRYVKQEFQIPLKQRKENLC